MLDLITADLHFSDNPRDEYRFAIADVLQGIMQKHKPDRLLILGDLTEQKDNHSARLVNRIVGIISAWASVRPVVILRGNHDGLTADNPFFAFTNLIPNIQWISRPRIDRDDLFLPHTTDYKRDWQAFDVHEPYRAIFCHQDFQGAQTETGHELPGSVPANIFSDETIVIAGDLHTPQRIGRVQYVGSPYTVDFGDDGGDANDVQHRVLLLNGMKLTSIPVNMPMKRLIEADSMQGICKGLKNLISGDIVKVRMKLAGDDYSRFAEHTRAIRAAGENLGLHIHIVEPVLAGKTPIKRQMAKVSKLGDGEIMQSFAKHANVNAATLKQGLELL